MKRIHLVSIHLDGGSYEEWGYVEGTDNQIKDLMMEILLLLGRNFKIKAKVVEGAKDEDATHYFDKNGHLWCKTPIKINI
ncbi:hypothetical protein [Bacillus subtilis]|uniref:hypothetical protein n=1 Tax=Bacillus subtilis TaxID=1423 RepID=UPI002DBE4CBC|nr:hypothetical protein [Bacillus subtilis]MEC2335190.1 hypothetical protein [Bacillus subtilis]